MTRARLAQVRTLRVSLRDAERSLEKQQEEAHDLKGRLAEANERAQVGRGFLRGEAQNLNGRQAEASETPRVYVPQVLGEGSASYGDCWRSV